MWAQEGGEGEAGLGRSDRVGPGGRVGGALVRFRRRKSRLEKVPSPAGLCPPPRLRPLPTADHCRVWGA